jgi:hypothetical protein
MDELRKDILECMTNRKILNFFLVKTDRYGEEIQDKFIVCVFEIGSENISLKDYLRHLKIVEITNNN